MKKKNCICLYLDTTGSCSQSENLRVSNYAIKFEVESRSSWKRGLSSSEDAGLQFRIILMGEWENCALRRI